MRDINQVAIVAGTHGNEPSGTTLIEQWQSGQYPLLHDDLQLQFLLANTKAVQQNRRYLDCDLNRQFATDDLANLSRTNYEQSRAKDLNQQLGPKGASRTDLVIDLHNTTSNMGATLILIDRSDFSIRLGAYVQQNMPEATILLEDLVSREQWGYLCSIGRYGVMVEVGSQPNGVVKHQVLLQMAQMTQLILNFVAQWNSPKGLELPPKLTVMHHVDTIYLPTDGYGNRLGMVHQALEERDFQPLELGQPTIILFNGEVLTHQGSTLYPHFINEAAYYDSHAAYSLAEKITITVPS